MGSNIVAAIDVGTNKTYTLISEIEENGAAKVIGYGIARTSGITQGIIVNPENVAKSISASVKKAEEMAATKGVDIKITSAAFSVGDRYLESCTKASAIKLSDKPREITASDKKELEDNVEKKYSDSGKMLLHKSVYNYRVDESGIVKEPIGKVGTRLEAVVFLVFGKKKNIDDLEAVAAKAGIKMDKVYFKNWATTNAAAGEDERKSGIIVVDVGAGTTTISIVKNGRMIYTTVIPMGGDSFTNDIAVVLDIDRDSAEGIKREIAVLSSEVIKNETIEIESKGKTVEVELLQVKEILDARSEELLENINNKIEESNFAELAINGIAFTGGAVKTSGFIDKARRVLNRPVRVADMQHIKGFEESLHRHEGVTGAGLMALVLSENQTKSEPKKQGKIKKEKIKNENGSFFERFTEKLKSLIFE